MHFSKKLMCAYLLVLFLFYLCFGVWYLLISYKNTITLNRSSLSTVVENATKTANIKLSMVQMAAEKINYNPQIIDILDKLDMADPYDLLKMDKDMQLILYNNFSHLEYIHNVQLVTRYYRFGANDLISSFSSSMFYGSHLYKEAKHSNHESVWIPTYDLSEMFPSHYYNFLDRNIRKVFSMVQKGNFIKLSASGVTENRRYKSEPYLLISFPVNFFEDLLHGLSRDIQYYVMTPGGQVVSSSQTQSVSTDFHDRNLTFLQEKEPGYKVMPGISTEDKSLICYAPIPICGWVLCLEMPMRTIISNNISYLLQMLLIFSGLTLPIFVLLAWRMSRSMSQPIAQLKDALLQTKKGDFKHTIDAPHTEDEFGQLIDQYNEMNKKISTLIHENYEQRLKQQESELRILNLHFNPHFIYNTLSTIYCILENKGDSETAELVIALIDMLRSSSRTDSEFWSLRQEIHWLNNYILIMKRRQNIEFSVDYYVAEPLLELQVLKHLLQPFVENAIIHGFAEYEGEHHIEIFASQKEEYLTIRIHDDGKGFDAEEYNRKIQEQSSATMATRSNRRIQLAYGKECGITVHSVPGEGTETVLRIGVKVKTEKID